MASTALNRALAFLLVIGCIAFPGGARAERGEPGTFDYYALVLSFVPAYCQREGRDRRDAQCTASRRSNFSLHGLWPQYEKGWPEDCPIGKRPWVPTKVIEEMRDIMPSKNLIIHEYRTHGTCSGLGPEQYFGVARELYERVSVPQRFLSNDEARFFTAEEIEQEFAAANPWLKPETIAVSCRGQDLIDIRICFGRDLFPRSCGSNEDEKRLCPAGKISIPPVTP